MTDPDFTVLMIADNESDRDLVRTHLEQRGVSVVEAATLVDGMALCGQADVILLDLWLPDAPGGVETVKQMAADCDQTPVVAITNHNLPGLGPACLTAGACEYLMHGELMNGERLFQKLAFIVGARKAIRETPEGG